MTKRKHPTTQSIHQYLTKRSTQKKRSVLAAKTLRVFNITKKRCNGNEEQMIEFFNSHKYKDNLLTLIANGANL